MNRYLVVTMGLNSGEERDHFVRARSAQEAADALKRASLEVLSVHLLTDMEGNWS